MAAINLSAPMKGPGTKSLTNVGRSRRRRRARKKERADNEKNEFCSQRQRWRILQQWELERRGYCQTRRGILKEEKLFCEDAYSY